MKISARHRLNPSNLFDASLHLSVDPVAMEPHYGAMLLDAVRARVRLLLGEIAIVDAQLPLFGAMPGTVRADSTIPALVRNIKATLCDLGLAYCRTLSEFESNPCPLKNAISCHLVALQTRQFQIDLQELYGHQSALTTLAGQAYVSATRDANASTDLHLQMGCLIFPYEFIFELLSESKFMNALLCTVLRYTIETHVRSVGAIFKIIKSRQSLKSFADRNQFFTNSDTVIFSLAEHFVTFFAHERMMRHEWLPLRNFSASEKASLMVANGISNCGLHPEIVQRLSTEHNRILAAPPPSDAELPYLRPVKSPIDPLIIPELEVPQVLLVVLELKKLPLQISPTLMVNTLSNAIRYLSAALACGGTPPGADEMFQFFVYSLACAKLRCLHGLTKMLEHFVHSSLRETRANYLMTQLTSGFDFIDNRMLPVQPYLIFPFRTIPERLHGVLSALDRPCLTLRGFTVFAFPCWSAQRTELFPALLRYTGEETDVAVCYQFQTGDTAKLALLLPDDVSRSNAVETSPTPHGTFFAVTPELIESAWMVKVVNGDFEESLEAVDTLSVLLLMAPTRIESPTTAMIPKVFEMVKKRWRLRSEDPVAAVRLLIAEIQWGLAILGRFDSAATTTGVMDRRTLIELKELFFKNGGRFTFTVEMADYIHKQVVMAERARR